MIRKWYVIQTKPRNEKKVYEQIIYKNINAYLPEIETIKNYSDRKKRVMIPLFTGYVFVYANEKERYGAISNTIGAIRYIMYQKRFAVVSDNEINNIKISLKAPDKLSIEKINAQKGDLVEVTHGVFKGLKGIISQIRGNFKLIININEINTSFCVQLNNSEVKLLKKI